jgi:hypothetical protein
MATLARVTSSGGDVRDGGDVTAVTEALCGTPVSNRLRRPEAISAVELSRGTAMIVVATGISSGTHQHAADAVAAVS